MKNPDIRLPSILPDTGYRIPDTDDGVGVRAAFKDKIITF